MQFQFNENFHDASCNNVNWFKDSLYLQWKQVRLSHSNGTFDLGKANKSCFNPHYSEFCGYFLDSHMLRVPFLPERADTTSEADLTALICLSEMVFPLPGSPAKCWPLLTLMLSPHCAKCYLWCHICPGKWSKTAAPRVSIGPTEAAATIPRDCLPAYFCPSDTHSDTHAEIVDTTHRTEDCQHEAVWFCSHKNNSLCG